MLKTLFLSFALFVFAGCRSLQQTPVPFENTLWCGGGITLCFSPDGNFKGRCLKDPFSGKVLKKGESLRFLLFHTGKNASAGKGFVQLERLGRTSCFAIRGNKLHLLSSSGETLFVFTAESEGKAP